MPVFVVISRIFRAIKSMACRNRIIIADHPAKFAHDIKASIPVVNTDHDVTVLGKTDRR
jgi:hypothetical protein